MSANARLAGASRGINPDAFEQPGVSQVHATMISQAAESRQTLKNIPDSVLVMWHESDRIRAVLVMDHTP
jgi:hypothetical protein